MPDKFSLATCALPNLPPTTPLAADKNSQKMRPLMHCQQLRMEQVENVKASNSRTALDVYTNVREKPLFASIDPTSRKSQAKCTGPR